jgi:hypothetical protein
MKRFFPLILGFLLAASCKPSAERLQTGDLIFVGIPADYSLDKDSMDSAITQATGGNTDLNRIHTAIAEVDAEGRTWIIDATIKHGVDRHPLDTFLRDFTLRDGSRPVFEVKRLKDDSHAAACVENAKKYLGRPYDTHFSPTDEALYCTELVWLSYLDADGKPLFQAAPMNFKNERGEFPLYWQQLFARLGEPIPQDLPGTNPQAMSQEPCLRPVAVELVRE